MFNKHWRTSSAGLGAATVLGMAAVLAGCGGTSTNSSSVRSTIASSPVAYGIGATFLANGGVSQDVSGLESADESTFYLTGTTASTSTPISTIQGATGTIPLGFPAGAAFENGAVGTAYTPGVSSAQVRFRVTLSNGTDANGTTYPINPSAVTLTSPDLPGVTIPFTFSPNTGSNYGLANATYVTAPFTLPALSTGLHTFVVSVADTKPQTTTTTYEVVVVNSSDAAALVLTTAATAGAAGGSVSITNPVAGTANPTTGDYQGEAVLFSAPGTQTITGPTATKNVTLVGGQLTVADSAAL